MVVRDATSGASPSREQARMSGKEATTSVQAGVGSPIKEVVWRVSLLNLAKRSAEKTLTKKPT